MDDKKIIIKRESKICVSDIRPHIFVCSICCKEFKEKDIIYPFLNDTILQLDAVKVLEESDWNLFVLEGNDLLNINTMNSRKYLVREQNHTIQNTLKLYICEDCVNKNLKK